MNHRGLTLLELVLALSITAMISAAVAGMLEAMASGVATRRDVRAHLVTASVAQARLDTIIGPSRCLLHVDKDGVVIWLKDTNADTMLQASELRWLHMDDAAGELLLERVSFPDHFGPVASSLEDHTLLADADFQDELEYYRGRGWTASIPVVDGVTGFRPGVHADVLDAMVIDIEIDLDRFGLTRTLAISAGIKLHRRPAS